jgi:serine/threonine protein kinase
MDRLSHPNIAKFYEVVDTSRQVFLVLEYINGGEDVIQYWYSISL